MASLTYHPQAPATRLGGQSEFGAAALLKAVWWGMRLASLLTHLFSHCHYMPQLRRYSLTKLCDGAKMAIFCVLYF